jgi:rubrerythrin
MNSINEILDFAIQNEEESYSFYMRMSERANDKVMTEVFLEFAAEEKNHKDRLIIIKENRYFEDIEKITDDLYQEESVTYEDLNPAITLSYRQALTIAIQKEQASYRLYKMLANIAPNNYAKSLFISLAEEEAKHKNRFQQEYDNFIVNNN